MHRHGCGRVSWRTRPCTGGWGGIGRQAGHALLHLHSTYAASSPGRSFIPFPGLPALLSRPICLRNGVRTIGICSACSASSSAVLVGSSFPNRWGSIFAVSLRIAVAKVHELIGTFWRAFLHSIGPKPRALLASRSSIVFLLPRVCTRSNRRHDERANCSAPSTDFPVYAGTQLASTTCTSIELAWGSVPACPRHPDVPLALRLQPTQTGHLRLHAAPSVGQSVV